MFSSTESEIRSIVALAMVIMALGLVAICCFSTCFARSVSTKIAEPVNQLVDVVQALNRMDFSREVCDSNVCVFAAPFGPQESWPDYTAVSVFK